MAGLSDHEVSCLILAIIKAASAMSQSERTGSCDSRGDSTPGGSPASAPSTLTRVLSLTSSKMRTSGLPPSPRGSWTPVWNETPLTMQEEQIVECLQLIISIEKPEHDDRIKFFVDQELLSMLLSLMMANAKRPKVLKFILSALCKIVSNERYAAAAISASVPGELSFFIKTECMFASDYPMNRDFQMALCDAILCLGNLAFDPRGRDIIRETGGIITLLDLFRLNMNEPSILDNCCYTFANLCVNNNENLEILVENKAIPLVIDAMSRFLNLRELIESGTVALTNLCAFEEKGRLRVAESGGIKVLAACLVEQIDDVDVSKSILRTLLNLSLSRENISFMVRDDSVISLSECISIHISRTDVCDLGVHILLNISEHCSANELSAILKEGAVSSLISCGRNHRENSKLQLSVLECLQNLVGRFPVTIDSPVTKTQVIPAILETISAVKTRIKLVRFAFELLSKLAVSESNANTIIELKGVQKVLEMLNPSDGDRDEVIFMNGMQVLYFMSHKSTAEKLASSELIEFLASILLEHAKDSQVIDICFRILCRLSLVDTVATSISRIALRPIARVIQMNKSSSDQEFLLMISTLFLHLVNASDAVVYLKSLLTNLIVKLLDVDRSPPITSQTAWHMISVLLKIAKSDETGSVRLKLLELGVENIIRNLKAEYQKQFHIFLEESIAELFALLSPKGKELSSARKQSSLVHQEQVNIGIREASLAKRKSMMIRGAMKEAPEPDSSLTRAKAIAPASDPGFSTNAFSEPGSVGLSQAVSPISSASMASGTSSFVIEASAALSKKTSRKLHFRLSNKMFDRRPSATVNEPRGSVAESKARSSHTRHGSFTFDVGDGSTTLHGNDLSATWVDLKRFHLKAAEVVSLPPASIDSIDSRRSLGTFIESPDSDAGSEGASEADFMAFLDSGSVSLASLHSRPDFVRYICKGIPLQARAKLWKVLSGSEELRRHYAPDYYSELLRIAKEFGTPHDAEIRKDITRTLPQIEMFQTEEGRASLERVLTAYCLRNPESVGYCQSMNNLCGALLTVMSEEDSFWTLTCMIENRMGYYCKSMCALVVDQRVLEDLISLELPVVYEHLKTNEIGISSVCVSWFLCHFFQTPLSFENSLRFWDQLFLFGDELLFQMALFIFRLASDKLVTLNGPSEILPYLLHEVRNDIPDIEACFKTIRIGCKLVYLLKLMFC